MTTLETTTTTVASFEFGADTGEAEEAAAGFLARYSGRTLAAYRHDLRTFFQWANDRNLVVLAATRSHIELYRMGLEDRGLAPATVDRRLTTVCGFHRFAHVDGRIRSNPAEHVRRPRVHPSGLGAWIEPSWAGSCSPPKRSHRRFADTILVDADGSGLPSAGDTIRYTATITNRGSVPADGVVFDLTLDPASTGVAGSAMGDSPRPPWSVSLVDLDANTSLVVGSVTTTGGNVVSGNSVGDSKPEINPRSAD